HDLGADEAGARADQRRRGAGGPLPTRRGVGERAPLGARGRPRRPGGGNARADRAPMSDNSRRGFLREIALAAGRTAANLREAAEADVEPAPPPQPRLSDAEMERYSRQLVLPEWTEFSQLALRDANVLVIGAGGLGAPVAMHLAGAGVGRLGIADADTVALSHLPRQPPHFTPDRAGAQPGPAPAHRRF